MPTPDLAGLSLGAAYQAGMAAGYTQFRIAAYRSTWALDGTYLWREVAPGASSGRAGANGYVMQTTTPGSGGDITPGTPPEGSFYTLQSEPGVPDQFPEPGDPVADPLSFVFQVPDGHIAPIGALSDSGIDPVTGVMAWWEYTFDAGNVPAGLAADMAAYNGPWRTPVDVSGQEWLAVAVDPLLVFSIPPVPDPADLITDVPQFERQSYEIRTVLRVVGLELARIAAAMEGLTNNYFPATADILLPRFESLLGLPVGPINDPDPVSLATRRALVLAYMQRLRTEGTGLDWIAAITGLAGTDWNYAEHDPATGEPPVYTINVNIPQTLARIGWNFVRNVTPAHLGINQGYVGGWLVGISLLDEASEPPGSGFDLL